MKNSNLITILSTFSPKEVRECGLWLASPVHNTRTDVVRLYDYLTNEVTGFKEELLDKEIVWQSIFPDEPHDENRMRQTVFWLLKNVEDFLVYQRFKQDEVRVELHLLAELRERRIEKAFEKRLRETEKMQEKTPLRNARFQENNYLLEMEKFTFAETQSRATPANLQNTSDALDIQYAAHRLRNECLFLSHQTLYKSSYQPKLLPEILRKVGEYEWHKIPAIGIYYHCYLALTEKEGNDEHFAKLLELLHNAPSIFFHSEVRNLYLLAINYIIKRINSGDQQAVEQAFGLYKTGVTQGFLLQNGVISPWTYRNTVICGTRLGEFEWTERFIYDYKNNLERKQRQSMFDECLSRFYYSRKDYEKAMQLLIQVDFKDILQNLTAKSMLAKIYYEIKEWETLESLLVSMKVYLHRKRVIGYHQENYSNFIYFMQKMLSSNLLDRATLQNLVADIEKANPLTEKKWILEQLQRG